MSNRVISYLRVSTEEQATHGVSLGAQRERIQSYAQAMELEIVETISDEGLSAKNLKRPGITRALGMLEADKADGLIVLKLDRLTRSLRDWIHLVEGIFATKTLLAVQDSVDTRTASGRLALSIIMSVAEWERQAIRERTIAALQHKIGKGERVGEVRYGTTLAEDGKTTLPNAEEIRVIEMMQMLRSAGMSYRAIARRLSEQGIPTKSGKQKWVHTAVARILRRAG